MFNYLYVVYNCDHRKSIVILCLWLSPINSYFWMFSVIQDVIDYSNQSNTLLPKMNITKIYKSLSHFHRMRTENIHNSPYLHPRVTQSSKEPPLFFLQASCVLYQNFLCIFSNIWGFYCIDFRRTFWNLPSLLNFVNSYEIGCRITEKNVKVYQFGRISSEISWRN